MKQPCHHPDSDLLLAHASGGSDPALSLLVTSHACLCPVCAEEVRHYEMIGGALLDDAVEQSVDDKILANVLASIDAGDAEPLPSSAPIEVHDPEIARLPEPLRSIAAEAMGKSKWSSSLPGIKTLTLDDPSLAPELCKSQLLRLEPGCSTPRHTHDGMEYTLVLQGAFHDETGRYGVGDVAVGDPGLTHRPIAEEGEVCISLAVTTAPLRFKGALGLLQKVLGQ